MVHGEQRALVGVAARHAADTILIARSKYNEDAPKVKAQRTSPSAEWRGDAVPVFKLGSLIDGRALGGKQGAPGPLFFDETGGELVLGSLYSAFHYRVTIHPDEAQTASSRPGKKV